jgi:hypothetical protein
MTNDDPLRGVYEAALEISKRWAEDLGRIKAALERGDDEEALALMRQFVGLAETGDVIAPRTPRKSKRRPSQKSKG